MRMFTEIHITRRSFEIEDYRRQTVAHFRRFAASQGFKGRISFGWRDAGHAGQLIAIRVWAG